MVSTGLFTTSDLRTISRAAVLAEGLTRAYFDLTPDEWKENPYTIFTHKHVGKALHEQDVFAHVVRYEAKVGITQGPPTRRERNCTEWCFRTLISSWPS